MEGVKGEAMMSKVQGFEHLSQTFSQSGVCQRHPFVVTFDLKQR